MLLLLIEGVDEDDAQTVVFDAFDFAFRIESDEQRINLCHIFRAETDIFQARVRADEGVGNAQIIRAREAAGEKIALR